MTFLKVVQKTVKKDSGVDFYFIKNFGAVTKKLTVNYSLINQEKIETYVCRRNIGIETRCGLREHYYS